jgi:hypothetical protein
MAKQTNLATEINRQMTEPTDELQERIRLRAYEIYEQRGGDHGHDIDDWLQAELELTQQKPEKVAA